MRAAAAVGAYVALTAGCATGDEPPPMGLPTSFTATDSTTPLDTTVSPPGTADDDGGTTGGSASGAPGTTAEGECTFCSAPNQQCIDDVCVTGCQGQVPDPCGPDEVCDVISGECRAPGAACTVSGAPVACGDRQCGPGSVCNGAGGCIPYAPCADVVCLDDEQCWGTFCSCERTIDCAAPTDADLNGAFSVDIGDLEFADDCTAWMVTFRSGTDFLRSLSPDGVVTEYSGVANLNMGEVAILRALTPPPQSAIGPRYTNHPPPPLPVEGIGEVAITYTCCPTCGCQATPPQGVARLDDTNAMQPLPLVIQAVVTGGNEPFGSAEVDSGPYGLTWGIDRELYVGNSTTNGDLHTADLAAGTQMQIQGFVGRVTAGAPLTASHIAIAEAGGVIHRYNTQTLMTEAVVDVEQDVTSLAFDAFSGVLYASLRNLEVVAIDPFAGTVEPFQTMAGAGRIAVSPSGRLYFAPMSWVAVLPVTSWDLPDSL
ncbi:MAG: hypothetical protein AAF721_39840 [Myxococcota bacterium]